MECIAVGIDVGGERKGFHAVALRGLAMADQLASPDPCEIADWCRTLGAQAVGVDAPCRWSATGSSRLAERALMQAGISCFASPRREVAIAHPRNYYGWMLRGEALFAELEKSHRLFDGHTSAVRGPMCFETFPQAIACVLAATYVMGTAAMIWVWSTRAAASGLALMDAALLTLGGIVMACAAQSEAPALSSPTHEPHP